MCTREAFIRPEVFLQPQVLTPGGHMNKIQIQGCPALALLSQANGDIQLLSCQWVKLPRQDIKKVGKQTKTGIKSKNYAQEKQ